MAALTLVACEGGAAGGSGGAYVPQTQGTTSAKPSPSATPPGDLDHWVIQPAASGIYTGADAAADGNGSSCAGVSRATGAPMQFCGAHYSLTTLASMLTDGQIAAIANAGTIPVIAFNCGGTGSANAGGGVTYAEIAAGSEDMNLRRDAVALKSYAAEFPNSPWVMVRPFFEFNVNLGNPAGNPNGNNCFSMPESNAQMQAEFVAAFRHVVAYFASQGVTNVTWLWCPTVGPEVWRRYGGSVLAGFYPGDSYVDWTCTDVYDKPSPGGGIANAFKYVAFFQQFNKPLIVAETAECNSGAPVSSSCYGYTQTQASYIDSARAALQPGGSLANAGIKALVYFDDSVSKSGYNWSFDSGGLAAFSSMVNTPFFHPLMASPRWQ